MRARFEARGNGPHTVSSMGTLNLVGHPADPGAVTVCRERGVDLSSHRSSALDPVALAAADHVFVMDIIHRELVIEAQPACEPTTHLLGSWPSPDRLEDAVPDPIGTPLSHFRRVRDLIETHLDRVMQQLV